MSQENKFNAVFSKKYKNFFITLLPQKSFSLNNISNLKISSNMNAYYIRCDLIVYFSDNKKIKNVEDYIHHLKDDEIVPFISIPYFIPYVNGSIYCDSKNFKNCSILFLDLMSLYYQKWNKKEGIFENLEYDGKQEILSRKTIELIEYLIKNAKMLSHIDNQLKLIIENKDFRNINILDIQQEFDLNEFICPILDKFNNNDFNFDSLLMRVNKKFTDKVIEVFRN